jgi:hypothetical protein
VIKVLLPQLSSLLIDEVAEEGPSLLVRARTAARPAACPRCDQPAQRVHAYHRRRLADLPAAGRGVVVELRVRRLLCDTVGCEQRTFREQVPALTHRWARRTQQLSALIGDLAVVLAGRAGAAVLSQFGVRVSRSTLLRTLMAMPTLAGLVPAVLSVDDFALRRGRRYAVGEIEPATEHQQRPDRDVPSTTQRLDDAPGTGRPQEARARTRALRPLYYGPATDRPPSFASRRPTAENPQLVR